MQPASNLQSSESEGAATQQPKPIHTHSLIDHFLAPTDAVDVPFHPYSLICVNGSSPLSGLSLSQFEQLWRNSSLKVCADGGANRLYDSASDNMENFNRGFIGNMAALAKDRLLNQKRLMFVPSYIVGDLDSVRADVFAFYQQHGSQIIKDDDQNCNDLHKALVLLAAKLSQSGKIPSQSNSNSTGIDRRAHAVIVLGAQGNRLDHLMALYSELHSWTHPFQIYAILPHNWATALFPDHDHVLTINPPYEGPSCGIIPLAGACRSITTRGLEWNLNGGSLEFGSFISTSNRLKDGEQAYVSVSDRVLFTVELKAEEQQAPDEFAWYEVGGGI